MRFFLISDDADTCVGLRLAGVESALVHNTEQALAALETVLDDGNVGILFVTPGAKKLFGARTADFNARTIPVMVEIPDSSGASAGADVSDYIRATVGINI